MPVLITMLLATILLANLFAMLLIMLLAYLHAILHSMLLAMCDKCDYTTDKASNLLRHQNTVRHFEHLSRRSKLRHVDKLKKDLNIPEMKFTEEHAIGMLEDCKGSIRELHRAFKWMRHAFGQKAFSPNLK